MANLLESVQGFITPDLVSRTSSQLGEQEADTAKAFSSIIPAVLAGLVSKTSEPGAMGSVFNLIRQQDGNTLSQMQQALPGTPEGSLPAGQSFLSEIFGGSLESIPNLLSNYAGIKPSSVSAILGYVASLILGFLSKKTKEENLDAGGLSHFLQSQQYSIKSALPVGLGAALGLGGLGTFEQVPRQQVETPAAAPATAATAATPAAATAATAATPAAGYQAAAKKRNWLWPILLTVAVILVILFLLRTCRTETMEEEVTITEAIEPGEEMEGAASGDAARALSQKELPGGVVLQIPDDGIESNLVAFIEDENKEVDKTTWFTFDRLHFETGSATILPESQEQLHNIAAILKAYPQVEIKIGGYTDNIGNPGANMKLSQSRANAVREALQQLGIAANRLEAEGYGEQHPVADNASEEGRAQNRRIDLRVTKK